jgi:hypothetical protein
MFFVEPPDGWWPQDTEVHKILAFLEKKGVDLAAARKKAAPIRARRWQPD